MSTGPSVVSPVSERLLNIEQVSAVIGLARRTIFRMISCGTFPRPDVAIGSRIRRWRQSTVEGWVEAGGRV